MKDRRLNLHSIFMNVLVLLLLCAAAILPSCTNDLSEISSPEQQDEQSPPIVLGLPDRATESGSVLALEDGDSFGLYMFENGNPLSFSTILDNVANIEYTYQEAIDEYTADTLIYYPVDGSAMSFIAYYPYISGLSDSIFQFDVNVGSQTDISALDIIWAKKANVRKPISNTPVALAFSHQMSKIVLNINPGDYVNADDLESLVVTVSGMPTTATFDVRTGQLDSLGGSSNSITMNTSADGQKAEAIIIPHDDAAYNNRKLLFATTSANGGRTYVSDAINGISYEPGKMYTFNVTIHKSLIEIELVAVAAWSPGDDGDLTNDHVVDYTGTGTQADPYKIYTARGLVSKLTETGGLSKYYKLMRNIEMGEYLQMNMSSNWAPLGGTTGFTGEIDGNGYAINGISISGATGGNWGFFTKIASGATVKNFGLTNATVTVSTSGTAAAVDSTVGILAAMNYGTVTNTYVSGSIAVNGAKVIAGGLVGINYNAIANSRSFTTVVGTSRYTTASSSRPAYVGGFVGNNAQGAVISDSSCVGTSVSTENFADGAGGFVGMNSGTISSSSAIISISVTSLYDYVGGFVGYNSGTISGTSDSYAASIEGRRSVGGFAGYNGSSISQASVNVGTVRSIGINSTTNSGTGGFVGRSGAGTSIQDCHVRGTSVISLYGASTYTNYTGGFVGYNAGSVNDSSSSGFDVVRGNVATGGFAGYNDSTITGCSSSDIAFVKGAAERTGGFVGDNNANILNSSASNIASIEGTRGVGGFAGMTSGARISNSDVIFGTISATASSTSDGGAGGFAGGSSTVIDNCHSEGNSVTSTSNYVGGFIGYTTAIITDSNALTTGSISGNNYTAGFVGYTTAAITDSYSRTTGSVSGNFFIAGLVGYTAGNVTDSYSRTTGSVSGAEYVGGVIGHANGALIAYARDLDNTVGDVSGTYRVGGFIGYHSGGSIDGAHVQYGTITGTSANADGANGAGGFAGRFSGTLTVSRSSCIGGSISGGGDSAGFVSFIDSANVTVEYCTSKTRPGSVISSSVNTAGGFVGQNNYGTIRYCLSDNRDSIIGDASPKWLAGGFAGYNAGPITECVALSGTVRGSYAIGGFVAYNFGAATISNSYAYVFDWVVGSLNDVGGFVGTAGLAISYSYCVIASVEGSYNVGGFGGSAPTAYMRNVFSITQNIRATSGSVSYLSGSVNSTASDGAYAYVGGSSAEDPPVTITGTPQRTVDASRLEDSYSFFKTQSTFTTSANWYGNTGWDFASIWKMDPTTGYPALRKVDVTW